MKLHENDTKYQKNYCFLGKSMLYLRWTYNKYNSKSKELS